MRNKCVILKTHDIIEIKDINITLNCGKCLDDLKDRMTVNNHKTDPEDPFGGLNKKQKN